jgi:methyl-accepting chemotaxis protein
MNSLESLQNLVARVLVALALAHVVLLAAIAAALGRPVVATTVIAALLAAAPAVALAMRWPLTLAAFAIAVALVGQTSILVELFSGHPWQVEMHFYYFAVLAMLSGFCEWRVLVAAAALVAAHHASLNFLLPAAVFPGGSNFARVLVHAVVVVIETAMLIGIGYAIKSAFTQANAASREAEQSAAEIERVRVMLDQKLTDTTARGARMNELLEQFQQSMIGATQVLQTAAEGLTVDSEGLGRAAAHASAQSAAGSAASHETAQKVGTAAHAGEGLAQTIAEVGANAAQSSELAAKAVNEAVATKETIDALAVVAKEIGQVTELIANIASQTNLLALNATIEAARAGNAGRGFAVVAQEVKALAGQTAAATQDIGRRIDAMRTATERSVDAIAVISGTIRAFDQLSERIANAVMQSQDAAREIAGSANSAAASVGQVDAAIGEIASVVSKTVQSAGKLAGAAANVTDQSRRIRDQVSTLKQDMHAMQA